MEFNPSTMTDKPDLKQTELVVDELVEGMDELEDELVEENVQEPIKMSCAEQGFSTDATLDAQDDSNFADSSLPGNLSIPVGLHLYESHSRMYPSIQFTSALIATESIHNQTAHKVLDEIPNRDLRFFSMPTFKYNSEQVGESMSTFTLMNLLEIEVDWRLTGMGMMSSIWSAYCQSRVRNRKGSLIVIGWHEIFWDVLWAAPCLLDSIRLAVLNSNDVNKKRFGSLVPAMCWFSMPRVCGVILRDTFLCAPQLSIQDEAGTIGHKVILWSYTRGFTSSVASEDVPSTCAIHVPQGDGYWCWLFERDCIWLRNKIGILICNKVDPDRYIRGEEEVMVLAHTVGWYGVADWYSSPRLVKLGNVICLDASYPYLFQHSVAIDLRKLCKVCTFLRNQLLVSKEGVNTWECNMQFDGILGIVILFCYVAPDGGTMVGHVISKLSHAEEHMWAEITLQLVNQQGLLICFGDEHCSHYGGAQKFLLALSLGHHEVKIFLSPDSEIQCLMCSLQRSIGWYGVNGARTCAKDRFSGTIQGRLSNGIYTSDNSVSRHHTVLTLLHYRIVRHRIQSSSVILSFELVVNRVIVGRLSVRRDIFQYVSLIADRAHSYFLGLLMVFRWLFGSIRLQSSYDGREPCIIMYFMMKLLGLVNEVHFHCDDGWPLFSTFLSSTSYVVWKISSKVYVDGVSMVNIIPVQVSGFLHCLRYAQGNCPMYMLSWDSYTLLNRIRVSKEENRQRTVPCNFLALWKGLWYSGLGVSKNFCSKRCILTDAQEYGGSIISYLVIDHQGISQQIIRKKNDVMVWIAIFVPLRYQVWNIKVKLKVHLQHLGLIGESTNRIQLQQHAWNDPICNDAEWKCIDVEVKLPAAPQIDSYQKCIFISNITQRRPFKFRKMLLLKKIYPLTEVSKVRPSRLVKFSAGSHLWGILATGISMVIVDDRMLLHILCIVVSVLTNNTTLVVTAKHYELACAIFSLIPGDAVRTFHGTITEHFFFHLTLLGMVIYYLKRRGTRLFPLAAMYDDTSSQQCILCSDPSGARGYNFFVSVAWVDAPNSYQLICVGMSVGGCTLSDYPWQIAWSSLLTEFWCISLPIILNRCYVCASTCQAQSFRGETHFELSKVITSSVLAKDYFQREAMLRSLFRCRPMLKSGLQTADRVFMLSSLLTTLKGRVPGHLMGTNCDDGYLDQVGQDQLSVLYLFAHVYRNLLLTWNAKDRDLIAHGSVSPDFPPVMRCILCYDPGIRRLHRPFEHVKYSVRFLLQIQLQHQYGLKDGNIWSVGPCLKNLGVLGYHSENYRHPIVRVYVHNCKEHFILSLVHTVCHLEVQIQEFFKRRDKVLCKNTGFMVSCRSRWLIMPIAIAIFCYASICHSSVEVYSMLEGQYNGAAVRVLNLEVLIMSYLIKGVTFLLLLVISWASSKVLSKNLVYLLLAHYALPFPEDNTEPTSIFFGLSPSYVVNCYAAVIEETSNNIGGHNILLSRHLVDMFGYSLQWNVFLVLRMSLLLSVRPVLAGGPCYCIQREDDLLHLSLLPSVFLTRSANVITKYSDISSGVSLGLSQYGSILCGGSILHGIFLQTLQ